MAALSRLSNRPSRAPGTLNDGTAVRSLHHQRLTIVIGHAPPSFVARKARAIEVAEADGAWRFRTQRPSVPLRLLGKLLCELCVRLLCDRGGEELGDAGQVANPRADRVLAGFLMETREVAWAGADRLRAFARLGDFSGRRALAMAGRVPTLRYNLSAWSFTS